MMDLGLGRRPLTTRKSFGKFNQLSFAAPKETWQNERRPSEPSINASVPSLPLSATPSRLPSISGRTPTKEECTPRNLVKKIGELQEKVMIAAHLTQFQKSSLNETLSAVNTFVYSLAAQYPDSQLPAELFKRIQALINNLALLIHNATSGGGRSSKYGIFQDRLSNLSPSVSTKSYYEDDLIQAPRLSVTSLSQPLPRQQHYQSPQHQQQNLHQLQLQQFHQQQQFQQSPLAQLQQSPHTQNHQVYQGHSIHKQQIPQSMQFLPTDLPQENHYQQHQYQLSGNPTHLEYPQEPQLPQEPYFPRQQSQYSVSRPQSPHKPIQNSNRQSMILNVTSPVRPEADSDSEFEDEFEEDKRTLATGIPPNFNIYSPTLNSPGLTPTQSKFNSTSVPTSNERGRPSPYDSKLAKRASLAAFQGPPMNHSIPNLDRGHQLPTSSEFDIGNQYHSGRPQSMISLQRRSNLSSRNNDANYRNSYAQSNFSQGRHYGP